VSNLQPNQKEVTGKDGKTRVYTFPDITVRNSIKAEQLWSGMQINYVSGRLSDECFDGIVWPLAEIILTGCTIIGEGEAHRIDALDKAEYFRNNFEEVLSAVKAGCEVLGFRKPEAKVESGSAPGQDGKTASKISSP
jgi:hypothetical protein